jgi:type II secretory pathway component GspD/PulD (secretin)
MVAATVAALVAAFASVVAAESYCNITEVKVEPLTNAVQITVCADGLLRWEWQGGDDDVPRQLITVRFRNARLKLDEHFIDVDTPPVSTIVLYQPQDADNGIGVVMEVNLTQRSRFKGTGSTDERSFTLTIDAPLRQEGSDTAKSAGAKGKQDEFLSVNVNNGLVSVRALRADIHRTVAEVARQTGLNITIDDAVSHKVNINLRDMPPLDVIKAIAAGYGLALSVEGDVYMLSDGVPRDLTTYNRSATSSFPMRYLRAEDAKELLPTFLTKYVQSNEEQNAVVATAPAQMLEKIQKDLKSVDVPPPLIMVEVVAVELTNTKSDNRDLSWLYRSDEQQFGTDTATGKVNFEDADPGYLTRTVANTSKLKATLQALTAAGRARIRSNPRIAAVNGKPAEIFIGQDRFILVEYYLNGQQQQRVEGVPVGVRLEVRPWTGGNGEITTRVDVEVSNISEIDPDTRLPLLSKRQATTTVRTKDGETIVIGGLRLRQKETTTRKIPLLGDVPLIGSLFSGESETNVDRELVVFVTPRILSVDGELRDAAQDELRHRLLEPGDIGYECPPAAASCPAPTTP